MLLTRDTLIDRLDRHLGTARRIDIAVAWAAECDALERFCEFARNGGSLKAIIGIWGNATHPNALRNIQSCAQLRIATGLEGQFHPKFYLFHLENQRICWIGSANLTRPGFQQNDELVFEFVDESDDASKWFDNLWNSLSEDCSTVLDGYEKNWQPPSPSPGHPVIHVNHVYELARELTDWSSFVAAITKADQYWSAQWRRDRPVTGEGDSWLDTITRGRALVRRKDWGELSQDDRRLLLGRGPYGQLGNMGGAGRANNVFRVASAQHRQIQRTIREALQPAIDANDRDFARAACDFGAAVEAIPRFGGAIATRFLALARPDRAVSVNRGSKAGLAELTGLPENTLSNAPQGRGRSYLDLLRWFEDQAWYSNPAPRNAYQALLASARVALIDAFVYEPQR